MPHVCRDSQELLDELGRLKRQLEAGEQELLRMVENLAEILARSRDVASMLAREGITTPGFSDKKSRTWISHHTLRKDVEALSWLKGRYPGMTALELGSPWKQSRSLRVSFRLTDAELGNLQTVARMLGLTVSGTLRRWLLAKGLFDHDSAKIVRRDRSGGALKRDQVVIVRLSSQEREFLLGNARMWGLRSLGELLPSLDPIAPDMISAIKSVCN